MKEIDNVLRIFEEAKVAIKNRDAVALKSLSNQTIHTASTTQDPDNVAVAVIVYSLSKIIERRDYEKFEGKGFFNVIIDSINNSTNAIKKGEEKRIKESLKLVRRAISKVSGKMKSYIQDVFRKAQINKASKIYEHGISMEKTASMLGITMFELAGYVGQKPEITEVPLIKTKATKDRLKSAMELFG